MRASKWIVLLAGALVAALAVLAVWDESESVVANQITGGGEEESEEPLARTARSDAAPATEQVPVPEIEEASVRTVQAVALFSGRLVDESGEAIANAIVTWTAIPPFAPDRRSRVRQVVAESSLTTKTTADGFFAFPSAPSQADSRESVVWATHPSFAALALHLAPQHIEWSNGGDYPMQRANELTALVTDGSRGVGSATVVQSSYIPGTGELRREDVLLRSVGTGPDGRAILFPFHGIQSITAETKSTRSPPVQGVLFGEVELTLGATFTLLGAAEGMVPESTPAILCSAVVGNRTVVIETIAGAVRNFGPLAIPLFDADEYVVRVEGEGVVPEEHRFPPPTPGELVEVDFHVELGDYLWFWAEDEEENVLTGAVARAQWTDDGRIIQRAEKARDNGYLPVLCQKGRVEVTLSHPGFVPSRVGPFRVPEDPLRTHKVTLQRAGAIGGRVVAGGTPVCDFTVTVWPTVNRAQAETHSFRDRQDGSFVIDEAPLGSVVVVAHSAGIGMSDAEPVLVRQENPAQITLELPTSIRAHGIVIDADTRRPVSGARAQLYVDTLSTAVRPVGPPRRVDADGHLVLDGLQRGETVVQVSSPQHAPRTVVARGVDGNDIDLGTIALYAKRPLRVRLLTDPDFDPSGLVCELRGPVATDPVRADAEGNAVFEGLGVGDYEVVVRPSDSFSVYRGVGLYPGFDWTCEVDLRTILRLDIRVSSPEGAPVPSSMAALVLGNIDSAPHRLAVPLEGGQAQVPLPAISNVIVEIRDTSGVGEVLAKRSVALEPGENRVEIVIGEGQLPLRVVDREGSPVPGTSVIVADTAGLFIDIALITDADGRCLLKGTGTCDVAWVYLEHPVHGRRLGIPIRPQEVEGELELVLEGGCTATVLMTGKHGPVVGIEPHLYDALENYRLIGGYTDEEGIISWENLAPGDYLLYFEHADYFPQSQPIRVFPGMPVVPIGTRRRIELRIEPRLDGLPLANTPIHLAHRDTGGSDVAPWVEAGAVTSNTGSMRTGPDGTLVLDGAPEGEYEWTVETADGTASGEFLVLWGQDDEVVLEL